jgi:hypothetical protein
LVVDGADLVELEDPQPDRLLAVCIAAVRLAGQAVGDLELLAGCLLLGEELVEATAGGEPVLLVAEEDVVDGELARGGVLPACVGTEADAAAFQGVERFL